MVIIKSASSKRGRYFLSVVKTNSFRQVYSFNYIVITFRSRCSTSETVSLWFISMLVTLLLGQLLVLFDMCAKRYCVMLFVF